MTKPKVRGGKDQSAIGNGLNNYILVCIKSGRWIWGLKKNIGLKLAHGFRIGFWKIIFVFMHLISICENIHSLKYIMNIYLLYKYQQLCLYVQFTYLA